MTPSTSAAIPRLRPADLPARPRPIERTLAVDVVAGSSNGLACLMSFAALSITLVWVGSCSDLRSHEGPTVASGVVERVYEASGGDAIVWGVVVDVAHDDDLSTVKLDDVTTYFDGDAAPHRQGDRVNLSAADDRGGLVIRGGRTRMHGPVVLIMTWAMLAIVAVLAAWVGIRARRHVRLLRDGELGAAKLVDRETDTSGDSTVHVLRFTFRDHRGRTRKLEQRSLDPTLLLDGDEPLLFDDDSAALLDALPGQPRVIDGHFVSSRPKRSLAVTVATALVLVSVPACVVASIVLGLR